MLKSDINRKFKLHNYQHGQAMLTDVVHSTGQTLKHLLKHDATSVFSHEGSDSCMSEELSVILEIPHIIQKVCMVIAITQADYSVWVLINKVCKCTQVAIALRSSNCACPDSLAFIFLAWVLCKDRTVLCEIIWGLCLSWTFISCVIWRCCIPKPGERPWHVPWERLWVDCCEGFWKGWFLSGWGRLLLDLESNVESPKGTPLGVSEGHLRICKCFQLQNCQRLCFCFSLLCF